MIGPVGILIAKKCGLKGGMDIPKWFPNVQKRRLCWRFLEGYLNLIGLERTDKLDQHFIETVAKILKQTSIRRKDERILTLSKNVYQNGIPID